MSPPSKIESLGRTASGEQEPKEIVSDQEQDDLLVSLEGLDGINLAVGLADTPAAGKDQDTDMAMTDSWELPGLAGLDSSSGSAERKDSDTDSWDEWLRMDLADVPGLEMGEDAPFASSPFEEVDWDTLLENEAALKKLQAGAGPVAQGILRKATK